MKPAVILIHGLWLDRASCWLLAWRLRRAGFEPRLFSYPAVHGTLAQNAARLDRFVAALPHGTIHFVGHSLGGVLAWHWQQQTKSEKVGRLVLLGSPILGSFVAGRLLTRRITAWLVGRCLADWVRLDSADRFAEPNKVGIIAGDRPVGIGMLLAPDLPRPHDGTVSLAETQLPGASHTILKVSHTGLPFSRAAAELAIQFLQAGKFPAK